MLKVPAVLGCGSRTFPRLAMACDVSDVAYAVCRGAEHLAGYPRVFLGPATSAMCLLWVVGIGLIAWMHWRVFVWFSTLDHKPKGLFARGTSPARHPSSCPGCVYEDVLDELHGLFVTAPQLFDDGSVYQAQVCLKAKMLVELKGCWAASCVYEDVLDELHVLFVTAPQFFDDGSVYQAQACLEAKLLVELKRCLAALAEDRLRFDAVDPESEGLCARGTSPFASGASGCNAGVVSCCGAGALGRGAEACSGCSGGVAPAVLGSHDRQSRPEEPKVQTGVAAAAAATGSMAGAEAAGARGRATSRTGGSPLHSLPSRSTDGAS